MEPEQSFFVRHKVVEVYLAQILNGVATSLISVFIPIYLIGLGFSLQQALLYVLVDVLVAMLFAPWAAKLASRFGLKKTTLLRIPFILASYLGLYSLSLSNPPVHFLLPAVMNGVRGDLYRIPLHALFTRYSDSKHIGSSVGVLDSVPRLFRIASPAVGGLIAASLGFPVLIIIALFMLSLSTIPLFLTGDQYASKRTFSMQDLLAVHHQPFMMKSLAEGFAWAVFAILFPLHIYFSLSSTKSLGLIYSIDGLVLAVSTYFIGRHLDRSDKRAWLNFSAVVFALTLLPRPFLSTALEFALIIIIGSVAFAFYRTSYHAVMFQIASDLKERGDEFIVMRHVMVNLGRVSALGLAIMLPWQAGFFIGAAALIIASWYGTETLAV